MSGYARGTLTDDLTSTSSPKYTVFTWIYGKSEVDDVVDVVSPFLLTIYWTERYDESCTGR